MRVDGREPEDLRTYAFEVGFVPWAHGSVLVSCGQTMVLCNVSVEHSVPPHCSGSGKGWLTAEYAMLPHAGLTRSVRDGRPKVRGRSVEIQRMIGRSLRAGINLQSIGGITFIVDCDVLKADGGTRTVSITGAWVALRMAIQKYYKGNIPPGIFRAPFLGAVSVGLVNGTVFLDLNYREDAEAEIDLNLVGSYPEKWIEIQGTSESNPQQFTRLESMIALGKEGLKRIYEIQKEVLIGNGIEL